MRFVLIESDGVTETHASPALGEYATLCGLDGDDESAGQRPIGERRSGKIDCADCLAMIRLAKTYKARDLATADPKQDRQEQT